MEKSQANEKSITERQYAALFIGMFLFIPAALISDIVFHASAIYGFLAPGAGAVYIGISSIVDRISILRPRGQWELARGKLAVFLGIVLLIFGLLIITIVLTPVG